jgi:hypothetical protein
MELGLQTRLNLLVVNPAGPVCAATDDCEAGFDCVDLECIASCSDEKKCPDGFQCVGEVCEQELSFRFEACIIGNDFECRDDLARIPLGEKTSLPGTVTIDVVIPLELCQAAIDADAFMAMFGAAFWLTGEVTLGQVTIPFVKSVVMVPDYSPLVPELEGPRLANRNPTITDLLTIDVDPGTCSAASDCDPGFECVDTVCFLECSPEKPCHEGYSCVAGNCRPAEFVQPNDEGAWEVTAGEDYRFVADRAAEDKETFRVLAMNSTQAAAQLGGSGCDAEETEAVNLEDLYYVKEETEDITIRFYGTCGEFAFAEKTDEIDTMFETKEDAAKKDMSVTWTAPDPPEGDCTLWFVMADNRGGVSWRELNVEVAPAAP